MMIGFALAAVGLDQMTGSAAHLRHTDLLPGFDFLIAVIGLFGIGEILLTMEEGLKFKGARQDQFKVVLRDLEELPNYWATSLRCCIIGCWMGITPGGATPASFMSYGIAKRFGKGRILARAKSKAWLRRKPRRTPPGPPHCCRCWRSAFPARRPRRCCSAAS